MIRPTTALLCALATTSSITSLSAETSQEGFDTMAQPSDDQIECAAPRPPKDLDSFAYVRNGYREILRIEAYLNSIDTDFCGCPFVDVDWSYVLENGDQYVTSDNPKLPFDVIELRNQADSLESLLNETCER